MRTVRTLRGIDRFTAGFSGLAFIVMAGSSYGGGDPAPLSALEFLCDDESYRVAVFADHLLRDTGDGGRERFESEVAASGAKYRRGETVLWFKGDAPPLRLEGDQVTHCRFPDDSRSPD